MKFLLEKQLLILSLFKLGKYKVNSDGNVYLKISGNWRLVKPFNRNSSDYSRITLIGTKSKYILCYAQCVIWLFFNGTYDENLQLNHIDGNKQNNSLANLEIVTRLQNAQHAVKLGLYKRGEESGKSDFTSNQIKEIKSLFSKGYKQIDISKKLKIHKSTVWRVINNKAWTHV
jgi:HNH endonuclease